MRLPTVVTLLLATSATRLSGQSQAPGGTDATRLQGTWIMVSGAADGVPMPPSFLSSMRRVLVGDTLLVTMGSQLYFKAIIQLDPGESPATIDYHMIAGFTVGAIQRGIYRFVGDTVVFCFAAPNAPRPTDFQTTPGDRRTLSSWVRTQP